MTYWPPVTPPEIEVHVLIVPVNADTEPVANKVVGNAAVKVVDDLVGVNVFISEV
jgi:hypothetical protein